MSHRNILIGVISIAVLAIGVFAIRALTDNVAAKSNSRAANEYVTLNETLDQLIEDFNAEAGSVRQVFVVGPSCGTCLRGLDDMNRVVGDMTRDNPDLKAFVVHVPTLRAEEHHAARAVRLMEGAGIRHYWDPEGQSGVELQKAMEIDAYAWDVWLLYDRGAEWTADQAPKPVHWEHQLGGLPRDKKLDPKRFAAKVTALLALDGNDG